MAGNIFINYRRGDDPGHTGRLFDRLQETFAPEQLFMDLDNIAPGLDFVRVLEEQVDKCDVLLAVIGPHWIDARDEAGGRRLDNAEDFVRIEIEAALSRNKRVIPVLVGEARMPRPDELPGTLKPLARRNAVRLTHERFRVDTQGLIKALQQALDEAGAARRAQADAARREQAAREREQAAAAERERAERRRETDERVRMQREQARRRGEDAWRAGAAESGERAGVSRRTIAIVAATVLLGAAAAGAIVLTAYRPQPPVMATGKLTVTGPDALAFAGEQGGPFRPANILLQLQAEGSGLHWSIAGTIPPWLAVNPDHGDLAAGASMAVTVAPAAAAQSLAPGRYEGSILFRNDSSGSVTATSVSVLASPKAAVPAGPAPLSAAQERALNPKDAFRECENCPQTVVIPAGSFTMGSPASEPRHNAHEAPQHGVTIARQFAVGQFDVTFDEWDACVAAGGCNGYKPEDAGSGRGRRPVIWVSSEDANAYVGWLSKLTGKSYRLLSEAEYEYATRAGTTTAYYWGSAIGKNNANCSSCGSQWDKKQTAPVGSFAANGFGLYDMVGNVWKWTQDCYRDRYSGAPADGSAWTSGDCSRRVLRGGSYLDVPADLRSAARYANRPDLQLYYVGFRVARTLVTP